MTSGIRVLSYLRFTRRDRFILAAALSFGVGDLLVPDIFVHLFDGVRVTNSGLQGLFDSITIVLSTPCESSFPPLSRFRLLTTMVDPEHPVLLAGIVAVILNLVIPQEQPDEIGEELVSSPVADHEANLDVAQKAGKLK